MYLQGKERVTNQCKAKTFHLPSLFVEDGDTIEIDGEYFSIQHPKSAHSNSDITITHQKSNVIFVGDIVLESTLGYFSEISSILENIKFLEKIAQQKRYALYVVGHGTSGNHEKTVAPYLYYLSSIKEEVSKAYKEDKGVFELQEAYINLKVKFT